MIVVMPSGWTPSGGQVMTSDATKDPFNDELLKDIIPFVEANYRTMARRRPCAVGAVDGRHPDTEYRSSQPRHVPLPRRDELGVDDASRIANSFTSRKPTKIPKYNSALKLFWWGWGETDIARANGLAVIDKFKSQGVRIETRETPGGHTWENWRLYLSEVAPKLFR